eukprot:g2613.t1
MCRTDVYRGDILVFRRVPAMVQLCALAQDMLSEFLGVETTKRILSSDAFAVEPSNIELICKKFESSDRVRSMHKNIMTQVGENLRSTFVDRIRFRVQPSAGIPKDEDAEGAARGEIVIDPHDDISDPKYSFGRFSRSLPVHRDTWGSGVLQQINWWGPLLPIDRGRTLQIFPSFFEEKVPNSSAEWDYERLKACRRSNKGPSQSSYPQMPVFLGSGDAIWRRKLERDALRVVVEPGDLIAFSGAHLHGSVPNRTGLSRFSTEWRSVHESDVRTRFGAPNVDGVFVRGARLEWFKNAIDGRRLVLSGNPK